MVSASLLSLSLPLLALIYQGCSPVHAQSQYPTVSTPLGEVEGVLTGNGLVNAYYGVPYATPPLGSLRFAYPQAASSWNGTFNATSSTAYGLCPQYSVAAPNATNWAGTEDCLRVDVYTPSTATANSKLPVVVEIPGGGYTITVSVSCACCCIAT
jgi:carboxylesterase type B